MLNVQSPEHVTRNLGGGTGCVHVCAIRITDSIIIINKLNLNEFI